MGWSPRTGRRATVWRGERIESVGAARCGAGILPAGPSSVGTAKEETMSLSEGLARLSARAKEAEDRAAAAKTEAREKLELARSDARAGAQETAEQLHAASSEANAKAKSFGEGLGRSWKEQLETVRQRADERKVRHEANKAEDDAEMAEGYAD